MNLGVNGEQYKFYRLYDIEFENAIRSLKILKRYKRLDIRYVLLRDISISYTKPFSGNKGFKMSDHQLKTKGFVPSCFLSLHKELVDLRNKIFAHADLTYRNPKVVNWSSGDRKLFPMSFKGYDYSGLNNRTSDLFTLISTVRDNFRKEIRRIENQEDDLVKKQK